MALSDKLGTIFRLVLLVALLYSIFFKTSENKPLKDLSVEKQNLIEKEGKLLKNGLLEESGYSLKYLRTFKKKDVYPAVFGIRGFMQDVRLKGCDTFLLFGDNLAYFINFCDWRYAQKVGVTVYDYDEKEFKNEYMTLNYFQNKKDFFEFQFENGFICGQDYKAKKGQQEFTLQTKQTLDSCQYDLTLKSDQLNEQISITKNLNSQHLYEMNTISEDKTHWNYIGFSMNVPCKLKTQKNCTSIVKISRANFFYNTYAVFTMAAGTTKTGEKISIIFQQGLLNKNSKSQPHAVMINDKIIKLEPLKLKFDKLNMNNGMEFQTYQDHVNNKREAQFVFQTQGVQKVSKNLFFIQNFAELVFGELSGYVTDDNGNKFEFENLKGFFKQSFVRG